MCCYIAQCCHPSSSSSHSYHIPADDSLPMIHLDTTSVPVIIESDDDIVDGDNDDDAEDDDR